MIDDNEEYPQYGYTQKELRSLYVDCKARILFDEEGIPQYEIRNDGPINPLRPDISGFWLKRMETE